MRVALDLLQPVVKALTVVRVRRADLSREQAGAAFLSTAARPKHGIAREQRKRYHVHMARDADPWGDAQTIRRLRMEIERLRQRLAGMEPQKPRPGRRARFPPLTLTWNEAAEFALRRSGNWLRANIDALPDFPRPHEKFERFSTAEIEAWVKRQFPHP